MPTLTTSTGSASGGGATESKEEKEIARLAEWVRRIYVHPFQNMANKHESDVEEELSTFIQKASTLPSCIDCTCRTNRRVKYSDCKCLHQFRLSEQQHDGSTTTIPAGAHGTAAEENLTTVVSILVRYARLNDQEVMTRATSWVANGINGMYLLSDDQETLPNRVCENGLMLLAGFRRRRLDTLRSLAAAAAASQSAPSSTDEGAAGAAMSARPLTTTATDVGTVSEQAIENAVAQRKHQKGSTLLHWSGRTNERQNRRPAAAANAPVRRTRVRPPKRQREEDDVYYDDDDDDEEGDYENYGTGPPAASSRRRRVIKPASHFFPRQQRVVSRRRRSRDDDDDDDDRDGEEGGGDGENDDGRDGDGDGDGDNEQTPESSISSDNRRAGGRGRAGCAVAVGSRENSAPLDRLNGKATDWKLRGRFHRKPAKFPVFKFQKQEKKKIDAAASDSQRAPQQGPLQEQRQQPPTPPLSAGPGNSSKTEMRDGGGSRGSDGEGSKGPISGSDSIRIDNSLEKVKEEEDAENSDYRCADVDRVREGSRPKDTTQNCTLSTMVPPQQPQPKE